MKGRENLTARISYDNGETWSVGKAIDIGPSAYSEITVLQDGSLGVLYEPGHSEIRFVRFTLEALTDGVDKLTEKYSLP
jgi:sialidase-1